MLTAEKINLPQEVFDALKNVVIYQNVKTSVKFSQKLVPNFQYNTAGKRIAPFFKVSVVPTISAPTTAMQGAYALNLIHNRMHQENYEYQGIGENGEFVFYKEEINFTLKGTTYNIPSDGLVVYQKDGKWFFERTHDVYTYKYNGVEYTFSDVADMLGISTTELSEKLYEKFVGEERNPETHITSIFCMVEKNGEQYINKTMFNGVHYKDFNHTTKITSYGKKCPGYIFRWIAYNDGPGNFGEVWRVERIANSDPKAESITITESTNVAYDAISHSGTMDFSRKWALVEIKLEELPAQGKNDGDEGYFDLKNSSEVQALPRVPGEGVVFI